MVTQANNQAKYGQSKSRYATASPQQQASVERRRLEAEKAKREFEARPSWIAAYGTAAQKQQLLQSQQAAAGNNYQDAHARGSNQQQVTIVEPIVSQQQQKTEQVAKAKEQALPPRPENYIHDAQRTAEYLEQQQESNSFGKQAAAIQDYEKEHSDFFWNLRGGNISLAAALLKDSPANAAINHDRHKDLRALIGKEYGSLALDNLNAVPDDIFKDDSKGVRDMTPAEREQHVRDRSLPPLDYSKITNRPPETDKTKPPVGGTIGTGEKPPVEIVGTHVGLQDSESVARQQSIADNKQSNAADYDFAKTGSKDVTVSPAIASAGAAQDYLFKDGKVLGLQASRDDPLQSFAHGAAGAFTNVYHDVRAVGEGVGTLISDGDYGKGAGQYYKDYHGGDLLDYAFQEGFAHFQPNEGTAETLERYKDDGGLLHNPAWITGSAAGLFASFVIPGVAFAKQASIQAKAASKAIPTIAKVASSVQQRLGGHAAGIIGQPVDIIPELSSGAKIVFTKAKGKTAAGNKGNVEFVGYQADNFNKLTPESKIKVDVIRTLDKTGQDALIPVKGKAGRIESTIDHKIDESLISNKNIVFSHGDVAGYDKLKHYKSDIVKGRETRGKQPKPSTFAEMKKYNPDQAVGKGNTHAPEFVDLGGKKKSGVYERINTNENLIGDFGKTDKIPVAKLDVFDSRYGKLSENKRVDSFNFYEQKQTKPAKAAKEKQPSNPFDTSKRDSITLNRIQDDLKKDTATGHAGKATPQIFEKHADDIIKFGGNQKSKAATQQQQSGYGSGAAAAIGIGRTVTPGTGIGHKNTPANAPRLDVDISPKTASDLGTGLTTTPDHGWDIRVDYDLGQEQGQKQPPVPITVTATAEIIGEKEDQDSTTRPPPGRGSSIRTSPTIRTPPRIPPHRPPLFPPIPPVLDPAIDGFLYRKGKGKKATSNKGFAGNTFADHFAGFANRAEITYGAKELKIGKKGKEKNRSFTALAGGSDKKTTHSANTKFGKTQHHKKRRFF